MSRDVDASKVVVTTVEGTEIGPSIEDRLAALEAENEALRAKLVERDVLTVEDVAEVAKPVKAEVPLEAVEVKR